MRNAFAQYEAAVDAAHHHWSDSLAVFLVVFSSFYVTFHVLAARGRQSVTWRQSGVHQERKNSRPALPVLEDGR